MFLKILRWGFLQTSTFGVNLMISNFGFDPPPRRRPPAAVAAAGGPENNFSSILTCDMSIPRYFGLLNANLRTKL